MSAVMPEATMDAIADEFAELDGLEVIESSELKIGGAYHSYTYITSNNEDDVIR
ncbi:hypothetical protein [Streptomyces yaizuensis]|uniref:Uncharacterized protein n=1 Tax=Streptomyces yaizuensis TaxID=2989713 RepID=A0ABQ5NXN1_9ACTN|nr:hypothetical protein [Streptomyces sp. YSPA8]GLF94913.1 hypothetical protein SYYSPA8_11470 [Streptomyces sp. YSPA8]